MPQHTMDEEHKELLLEEIDLALRSLELDHALAIQEQKARRAIILGDVEAHAEIVDARNETAARIRDLNADIRGYNSRAKAHMGEPPESSPDIPPQIQGLLDAIVGGLPGAIVVRVGGGPSPFGGFTPEGAHYGSGSADGPE